MSKPKLLQLHFTHSSNGTWSANAWVWAPDDYDDLDENAKARLHDEMIKDWMASGDFEFAVNTYDDLEDAWVWARSRPWQTEYAPDREDEVENWFDTDVNDDGVVDVHDQPRDCRHDESRNEGAFTEV